MLKIEGKTFMNIQEAVQWLLDNNALPFQSSANYQANTEIGLGTIVNPSPAKVRIGSLIFFADSKVSTVVGITETSFICSDKYNNLVDDIAYVTNVAINASGHLITTLSDGQTIDAGIVKQVSGFSINASQHLIVTYNDGSTTDLGAIFNGNISIAGNLTVSGGISGSAVTGDSIIENMAGYAFVIRDDQGEWTPIYCGIVKNGNKLTFVIFGSVEITNTIKTNNYMSLTQITIPSAVGAKLYPFTIGGVSNCLAHGKMSFVKGLDQMYECSYLVQKNSNVNINVMIRDFSSLTENETYLFRIEQTFLLSDNLAS